MPEHPSAANTTLGILAGGRATRLGGVDKAWIEREGLAQVLRWQRRFAAEAARTLVSANAGLDRYRQHGLEPVTDRTAGAGPLGALDALAARCASEWLLTVPVDLVGVNECLVPSLAAAGGTGACAEDDDGVQPLVALWRVRGLRTAAVAALAAGELSVQALQHRLGMPAVRFAGVRFGNLNTPADLRAAAAVPGAGA